MQPYYEHAGITIYHCDCREIIDSLEFDVVVTDPPYGLDLGSANNQQRSGGHGGHLGKRGYNSYLDTYENFVSLVVPALNAALGRSRCAAVFTGPHIHEQRKPAAIGGVYSPAATGRTPWGSKNFLPVLLYGSPINPGRHRPTVIRDTSTAECNGHPCPKPIGWLRWLIELCGCSDDEKLLDPFMGSGTTLRAAKDLGRRAVGVEIEERYCEIAAKRLSQEVLDLGGAA